LYGFRNKGEEIRRLNVFNNMVLRKLFGLEGEEAAVDFRGLHIWYI